MIESAFIGLASIFVTSQPSERSAVLNNDGSNHYCQFNTVGKCSCGMQLQMPEPETPDATRYYYQNTSRYQTACSYSPTQQRGGGGVDF